MIPYIMTCAAGVNGEAVRFSLGHSKCARLEVLCICNFATIQLLTTSYNKFRNEKSPR